MRNTSQWIRSVVASLSFLSAACSGTPGERIHNGDLGIYSSADILTADDLASIDASTTPEAVMRLRPTFLRGSLRAPIIGAAEIAVYVNGKYDGDTGTLAMIPLRAIRQMLFMHPSEARIKFGPLCRCANGAIVVTTGDATR